MPSESKILKIHTYLEEKSPNPDQTREFMVWLEESEENTQLFDQISTIWQGSENYSKKQPFDSQSAYNTFLNAIEVESKQNKNTSDIETVENSVFEKRTNVIQLFSSNLFKYAAVFLVLVLSIIIFNRDTSLTYSSGNESLFVQLSDGTEVWLNKNSTIKVSNFEDKYRRVEVEGEAFFDVFEDKNKPFKIKAKNILINVLGTTFVVNTNELSLVVKSGKVNITYKDLSENLVSDQKIQLLKDTFKVEVVEEFNFDWINQQLVFDNTPFDKVIRDLELKFNVKIEIMSQKDWSKCNFTSGSLARTSFEEILTLMKLTYDLEVVKVQDTKYKISKVSCK